MTKSRVVLLSALIASVSFGAGAWNASAQSIPPPPNSTLFKVRGINYDMWCQEQAHLPPDRCDKRLPEDEKRFNAFRDKVEKYEIPYLEEKQNEIYFNHVIMHSDPMEDPVDHPVQPTEPNP